MKSFLNSLLAILLTSTILTALANESDKELSAKQFLYQVRHPAGNDRWAAMSGKVHHLRRGQASVAAALYLGILFSAERTLAQIIIDNKQGYYVGQDYASGDAGTSVIPLNPASREKPLLNEFGLRPEDLAMSFLYWKFRRELAATSVRGFSCRVMELDASDGTEYIHAYLSSSYFFPIRVEWFKTDAEAPFRTMEVSSFKKQQDYYLVKSLRLYGPGWRSRVEFDHTEVGVPEPGKPPRVFRKLNDAVTPHSLGGVEAATPEEERRGCVVLTPLQRKE